MTRVTQRSARAVIDAVRARAVRVFADRVRTVPFRTVLFRIVLFGVGWAASGLAAPSSPASAQTAIPWNFRAEAGAEVDMLGEEFGSGALFDIRLDPDDPLDETTEDLRFRDATTRTSGLLRLRLDRVGSSWLQARGTLKSSLRRTRGDVELSGGLKRRAGDLAMSHRFHAQGGEDDPGSGFLYSVSGHWKTPELVHGIRLRAASVLDLSRAQGDSLSRLFDYEVWRPNLELSRAFGWTGYVRTRGGINRRETSSGSSSYDARYLELGGSFGVRHPWRFELRSESRAYDEADSLSPSFHEGRADLYGERQLHPALTAIGELEYQDTQYSIDSSVYRDNRRVDVSARLATDPARWTQPGDAATATGDLDALTALLQPAWTLALGARYVRLRYEETRPDDFDAWSLLLGLGRDGTASTWFDGTLEWGRRTYRTEQSALDLVFEGLNLNLSGTNYTFVSASVLGEAALYGPLRFTVFSQLDKEFHSDESDDFLLWIVTSSLIVDLW